MLHRVLRAALTIAVVIFTSPITVLAQITPELIEAAKKEGEVMFYGAITVSSSKAIGDAFEKKYGIKLRHWRGDATELINRSLAEARAGKPGFDVTLGNEVVMASLVEKNLFAVFEPPAAKGYPDQFLDAGKKNDALARAPIRHQLQPSALESVGGAEDLGRTGRSQVEGQVRHGQSWNPRYYTAVRS